MHVTAKTRLIGGSLLEIASLAGIAALGDAGERVTAFLLLFAIAATGFLIAAHAAFQCGLRIRTLVVGAILFRLILLPTTPSLSDDVWRYLHDARAQRAGVSPFAHAPADSATAAFRGPAFERINHPELVTIYPPAAQLAFVAASLIGPGVLAWKLVLLAAESAIILLLAALLRRAGRSVAGAVLYAWHPLAIVEVAGSAHLEPIAMAPLLAAIFFTATRRPFTAGVAIGLSIAAKYFAIPLLALLDRQRTQKIVLGAAMAITAVALPYALAGPDIFGSLFIFGRTWASNAGPFRLLELVVGSDAARVVVAVVLLGFLAWLWRSRTARDTALLHFVFAVLLLSPVVHPWYLLWALALLPLAPPSAIRYAALLWSITVPLAYLAIPPFRAGEPWSVPLLAVLAQYLPVFAILLVSLIRRRARLRSATPAELPAR